MNTSAFPAGTDWREWFGEVQPVAATANGTVWTSERVHRLYVIVDDSDLADAMDLDEGAPDEFVRVYEFDDEHERSAWLAAHVWSAQD